MKKPKSIYIYIGIFVLGAVFVVGVKYYYFKVKPFPTLLVQQPKPLPKVSPLTMFIESAEAKEIKRLENRIKELQPRLDPALRKQIVAEVMKNSKLHGLSPSLIIHLIWRETIPPFNPLSKSSKDAIGLMQVMYEVHEKTIPEVAELGPIKLFHVSPNIKFGCIILRDCLAASKGNLKEALKRYVGGEVKGYTGDIFRKMSEYETQKWAKPVLKPVEGE